MLSADGGVSPTVPGGHVPAATLRPRSGQVRRLCVGPGRGSRERDMRSDPG